MLAGMNRYDQENRPSVTDMITRTAPPSPTPTGWDGEVLSGLRVNPSVGKVVSFIQRSSQSKNTDWPAPLR